MSIEVKSYELVETKTVNKITVEVMKVKLNTSCLVSYQLFDVDKLVKVGMIDITGDEYSAWGADDTYLVNLTLQKLGLTQKL